MKRLLKDRKMSSLVTGQILLGSGSLVSKLSDIFADHPS
jgi:hypothetical protein